MMPKRLRCKAREMEKVENLYRTAAAQKVLSTRRNNSDHACATERGADSVFGASVASAGPGIRSGSIEGETEISAICFAVACEE